MCFQASLPTYLFILTSLRGMRRHRRLPPLHNHHILWHETCSPKASKPKIHTHPLPKRQMAALAPRPTRYERRNRHGAYGHVAPPRLQYFPKHKCRSTKSRRYFPEWLNGRRRSAKTNKHPNRRKRKQEPIRPQHNDLQNPARILRGTRESRAGLEGGRKGGYGFCGAASR